MDGPDDGNLRGSVVLKQRDLRDGQTELDRSKYMAKFGNLVLGESYSLALLDDDVPDCGSQLEPLFNFDDKSLSAEEDHNCDRINGRGDIDVLGDDSVVGKYVQISDSSVAVGCCRIELVEEGERPVVLGRQ